MAVSQPNELPYLYSIYGHHRRFHERMGVSLCFETRDGTLHQCLKRLLVQKWNVSSFIILMFVPNPFFLLWATKYVRDLFHFHCIFFPDNKKVNGVWRHHSSKLKITFSLRMNYPFKTKAVWLIFIHIKVSALNCVLCAFWETGATGYSQACPLFWSAWVQVRLWGNHSVQLLCYFNQMSCLDQRTIPELLLPMMVNLFRLRSGSFDQSQGI